MATPVRLFAVVTGDSCDLFIVPDEPDKRRVSL